jgi:hypothetical protein
MFRGFVENRQKQALLEQGQREPAHNRLPQAVPPFNRKHILLHLLVITSFLGLTLTGLPLRFSDQQWASILMVLRRHCQRRSDSPDLWGGRFPLLLFRHCNEHPFPVYQKRHSRQLGATAVRSRLLFPNLKDIRDITAMMRWFLFKGPKPSFERWTYWKNSTFRRLLGHVRNRRVWSHALVPGILRPVPARLDIQYRHHRSFR